MSRKRSPKLKILAVGVLFAGSLLMTSQPSEAGDLGEVIRCFRWCLHQGAHLCSSGSFSCDLNERGCFVSCD